MCVWGGGGGEGWDKDFKLQGLGNDNAPLENGTTLND